MADYALTHEHFVAGTEHQQQAAIFKTDRRPILWQEEFKDNESLIKVPYFSGQISCRLSLSFSSVFPPCFQNTHKPVTIVLTQQQLVFSQVAQAHYESPEQHYPTVIWVKNCRSKKGLKQCLGGLKCSQNIKKNNKTLKVSFKAIFNVHFANLVSKEYFSIQRLIIFLLYE